MTRGRKRTPKLYFNGDSRWPGEGRGGVIGKQATPRKAVVEILRDASWRGNRVEGVIGNAIDVQYTSGRCERGVY